MSVFRCTIVVLAACLGATAGATGEATAAESFPTGYAVDIDESGVSTGALGGSGSLVVTGSYGRALECEQSANGGPFSSGYYPPLNCAEVGRNYTSSGSPERPSEFLYTGNEHCVQAGRPLSGANFYWHVQVPHTGYWHVAAYVPAWTQYGTGNIYVLTSDDGISQSGSLWEQGLHGQWAYLFGPHRFTAGQDYTVQLTLADGEDPYCHYQAADQMQWIYDGPSSPSAQILSPERGSSYPQGAIVATRFACSEALNEPLASCTDSNGVSGGSGTLDTSKTGSRTYVVTATGINGATATAEVQYTVLATKVACAGSSGKLTLSPGLTETPTVQTAKLKGTLTGCSGGGFTEGRYTAVLTTAAPVACSVLAAGPGQQATGTLKIIWKPSVRGGKSFGSLHVTLAQAESAIGGALESGMFARGVVYGGLIQTYADASQCGVSVRERVRPIRKATFTSSPIEIY